MWPPGNQTHQCLAFPAAAPIPEFRSTFSGGMDKGNSSTGCRQEWGFKQEFGDLSDGSYCAMILLYIAAMMSPNGTMASS